MSVQVDDKFDLSAKALGRNPGWKCIRRPRKQYNQWNSNVQQIEFKISPTAQFWLFSYGGPTNNG